MNLNEAIDNLISEEVSLLAEKLRGGFNLSKFKALSKSGEDLKKTIGDLHAYAENHLDKTIGKGSSRFVYALSGNKALKIAVPSTKTEAGIEQNKQEVDVYTNPATKAGVAKILDYDPEYKWIISEIVKPISYDTAMSYLGIPAWVYQVLLSYAYDFGGRKVSADTLEYLIKTEITKLSSRSITRMKQITIDSLNKTLENLHSPKTKRAIDLINTIVNLKNEIGLHTGDLKRAEHYGLSADGRIVVLDYGLSGDIYDKYYTGTYESESSI